MQRPIFHQNVAFRSCRCNQNAFSRTGTIYARFRQQRGITGDCSLRRSLLSVRSGPDTDAELEEEIPVLSTKLLKQLFDGADTNKNGLIEREELAALLEKFGLQETAAKSLSAAEILQRYDKDGSNDIDFDEFCLLAADGLLLNGKLAEYQAAFQAADTGGDGKVSAMEIAGLLDRLGQPVQGDKMFSIMDEYDVDQSGSIDFNEFLGMFSSELLDLQEILEYAKLRPAVETEARGEARVVEAAAEKVTVIFSEEELNAVLEDNPSRLIVLEASLSWCRPCRAFTRTYEKLAAHYAEARFLKFYGNSNASTKHLFQERLKTGATPSFTFFRGGEVVHSQHGANKQKVDASVREFLYEDEKPALNAFQKQVWEAKLLSSTG